MFESRKPRRRSAPRSAKDVKQAALAAEREQVEAVRAGEQPARAPTERAKPEKPAARAKAAVRTNANRAKRGPKLFVIDTNVLLHDPSALHRFEENDLFIPITVLEEVDHFKKGPDTLNFHAREIARELDELLPVVGVNDHQGTPLGPGLGNLHIHAGRRIHELVRDSFTDETPDHRILSAACDIRETFPGREVVLISKDVSLRLKARSLGLPAEDYESDKVPELDKLYKGRYQLDDLDPELIDRLYADPFAVELAEIGVEEPYPNSYFILKSSRKSGLARYDSERKAFMRVDKRNGYGIIPRNSEQTFALNALLDPEIMLVTLAGKAGTGKTLIALAGALEARRHYDQIYLARPVVPLGRQQMGYLPGDVEEKLDPFMQPLWDNLGVIRGRYRATDRKAQAIDEMLKTRKLNISALAYIRGRSLNRIFFIVDEAQNLTGHEVKTIITRAGEGTKIVLTGDPHQIDSPYLDSRSNGLTRLIDRMKGQKLYAHVTLEKGERSRLSDLASNLL
ncbi:MAG: PhoH-like protein [Calditrichaeota bacterium]|nr:PhoH-like protein [Calditrichota bacterium]